MKKYKKAIYKKTTAKSIHFLLIIGIISLFIPSLPSYVNAATVDDFMPNDSLVYLKLQDLDEVYTEITTSEVWKKTTDELFGASDSEDMRSRLLALEAIIGTDVYGVIDTIGYQTGLALWIDEDNTVNGGLVIHSGGNLKELQRFTKIVSGTIGLAGGTLSLDAGEHRKVKYNMLKLEEANLTYGFIGDFLVVGKEKNSFEKLIDTYRKKIPSIKKKDSFAKVSKKLGSGELRIFANVAGILPYIDEIDENSRVQLETFTNFYANVNLLDTGPFIKIHTEFNDKNLDSRITPFLKEGDELKILNSMSGKEDLFVAAAPGVLDAVWQLIQDEIRNAETDDVLAIITYLEGILNLNFEGDFIPAMTGEIALSVDDLSLFDPSALESLDVNIDNSLQVDATNVETDGGLLFISNNKSKWDQLGNSILNLQNASISSFDYKGKKVTILSSNFYYTESNGLALMSFSEDQIYSLVDRMAEKKKKVRMKHVPKSPLVFAKLSTNKLLQVIQDNIQDEITIKNQDELFPIFAWIAVSENVAMLEVILSEKESPIEVFAKIAPIVIPSMQY